MVEPNQPLALLSGLVLIATLPSAMVLAMASNAAWLDGDTDHVGDIGPALAGRESHEPPRRAATNAGADAAS